MAKVIMVQGTMSNAGKSLLVAGLCRIFRQDGYRVAPFKSQNMALNSYITKDGYEMGRAQVMQAEAAGIEPNVAMNPILLKPTTDVGSQVIVHGRVIGNMKAREYFAFKKTLIPEIRKAFHTLEKMADIIVIEGAGSPAEINLKQNDIVNMGMAELVDAPVLLVGDIDRGGVFAQLLGTLMLLEPQELERIKGLIINKFRGDASILDPGINMLEERGKVPVVGVLPYMHVMLEDEDSLSEKFEQKKMGAIDIAVICFPRISNFTDFDIFARFAGVSVRYVRSVRELGNPDLVILPGSKSTIGDLRWMRQNGLESAICKLAHREVPVFGICGGYQMLGSYIEDPMLVEGMPSVMGMGLLPHHTEMGEEKVQRQVTGVFGSLEGIFADLSGKEFLGYEIHMGRTKNEETSVRALCEDTTACGLSSGACKGNVYGCYVHGIFDGGDIAETIVQALAKKKNLVLEKVPEYDYQTFKEQQYDLLAEEIRKNVDLERIYEILSEVRWKE